MQRAKSYTVRRLGVPVGTVTLDANELISAGVLNVAATFVNLIAPPNDERIVVLARFGHAHASR